MSTHQRVHFLSHQPAKRPSRYTPCMKGRNPTEKLQKPWWKITYLPFSTPRAWTIILQNSPTQTPVSPEQKQAPSYSHTLKNLERISHASNTDETSQLEIAPKISRTPPKWNVNASLTALPQSTKRPCKFANGHHQTRSLRKATVPTKKKPHQSNK